MSIFSLIAFLGVIRNNISIGYTFARVTTVLHVLILSLYVFFSGFGNPYMNSVWSILFVRFSTPIWWLSLFAVFSSFVKKNN